MLSSKQRKPTFNDVTGTGTIDKVVRQGYEWRVRFNGTYWTARSSHPVKLQPGDQVRIMGRQGTMLLIEPVEASLAAAG
jgi:membrane protein implicated in regulation of membrane protease activity